MSRAHISAPLKSNAFSTPVPVITHTFFPSVTGEGDDMFCFRILVLPLPSGFFQTGSPLVRSRHHKKRSLPSAMFRKILPPQMIGVEPLQLGSPTLQVTFSSALQRVGRFASPLMPFRDGPRHWGQFSARTNLADSRVTRNASANPLRTCSLQERMADVIPLGGADNKSRKTRHGLF